MSIAKHNWTKDEIIAIYNKPMMDLLFEAASIHRKAHDPNVVQVSTLLSIKTGGCPEDCGYCPQAARYHTEIEGNDLMSVSQVKAQALRAKSSGSSRVCMGAAWRNVKDGPEFDQVLEMVRTINKLDMEVCCTLGMITENQAHRLAEAGLYAYNHNLDTSEEYYKEVFGDLEIPSSEEEYREKIKANLENYYRNESELWLDHQIGHLLMEKHNINLPDEFLKRWLITTKENEYTFENIDEKYAEEKSALQRRLVIDKIAAQQDLKSTEAEIREEARIYFHGLYRQYGLNIPMNDAFLDESINKKLAEREFVMQMADRVIYRKAYDAVKELITIKSKKISVEDYFSQVNAHKSAHGE
jgi:pyruvate-formate lyase-activating enzyme